MSNPKARQQLLECLYKEFDYQESLSETSSDKKSVEMKDEEIQAFDAEIDRYLKRNSSQDENNEADEIDTEEEEEQNAEE